MDRYELARNRQVYLAAPVRTPSGRFGGAFTNLTAVDLGVNAAEAAIHNFTEVSQPEIFTRLHKYGRQYFGIIVKGRKRIYCNFFMNPKEFPSRFSRFVLVLDGGNDYFRIEYDVDSKTCLNFLPNGSA